MCLVLPLNGNPGSTSTKSRSFIHPFPPLHGIRWDTGENRADVVLPELCLLYFSQRTLFLCRTEPWATFRNSYESKICHKLHIELINCAILVYPILSMDRSSGIFFLFIFSNLGQQSVFLYLPTDLKKQSTQR